MEASERLIRHPGLDPLWRSIEREHRGKLLAAVVLVTGGLLLCVFSRLYSAWWPFAGSLSATLGAVWLLRSLGRQPVAAWREDLRERPGRFVWVYGMVTERMPFGLNLMRSGVLYIYDDTGEGHSFSMPADQLLLVTKTLNRLLPRAEFGYTQERELHYRGEISRLNK
ncbi:hypothetical protein CLV84_0971 [Neolewinella xylanilytica]|uniref:Uncharacterized protein n=1 Tax=Neolewinella xylanilytica TaxID=1514080 RepID=A0A2S6I948_9BACT|nr:hypothetical protein [Neolewinella xylanilytica]PPK88008.1 hypothetical protein CLV84_0971 [Neolewinella xylanilytica]